MMVRKFIFHGTTRNQKKIHTTIMLDMGSSQVNQNQELPCLQAGKGLPERECGQKARAKKSF
jgi:hypothetical protein